MKNSEEEKVNLTGQTVNIIREMIKSSGLKPGDKFARESELAEKLNISRPILREAVNRLRAINLLESRQGVGLIIGKPNSMLLFEEAFDMGFFNDSDMKELAEMRYALEIGVVDQVIQRATPDKISRLEDIAEEIAVRQKSGIGTRSIDEMELDFHSTYLELSNNSMLIKMHNVIVSFFHRAMKEMPSWNEDLTHEKSVWDHLAIVQALRERNTERLRSVLSGHLENLLSIDRDSGEKIKEA